MERINRSLPLHYISVMDFSLESVDILRDALKNNNIETIENFRNQCDLSISVKVREKGS